MVRLVEYHIISGRTIETRRSLMDVGRDVRRARRGRMPRVAGNTSARKMLANEREAVKRLARILNCNFGAGDLWLQLKYSNARMPESREAAKKDVKAFLKKAREAYRRETGRKLQYVLVTSDTDPRTGKKTRLHHHLVMDRMAWDVITRYWPAEEIGYVLMDGRGDYTGIARYMVSNAGTDAHERRWSTSLGLEKPIYTEPVEVDDVEGIEPVLGAEIRERVILRDAETGIESAYLRCVLPEQPEERRGRVRIETGV